MSPDQEPAPSRKVASAILKVAVTLALYVAVFYVVDVSLLLARLRSVEPGWMALAVVCYAAGQWTSAWRWHLLLRPVSLTVGYLRLVAFYFIGMFFNIFLPTIVGGDAVKAILLARETGAPARSVMSVFMERDVGLLALFAIATTAAWFAPPVTVIGLPVFTLVLLLFAAFIAANIVIFSPRAYRLVDRIIALTPLASIRARASSLYEAVVPYRRAGGPLAASLALSFVFQAVVILVVFLTANALSHDVPILALAVFVPLISVAGMLPISVNGLGIREALYMVLFGLVDTPPDVAVSMAMLYFAVTLVASLPGGLVYAFHRRPGRLNDEASTGNVDAGRTS